VSDETYVSISQWGTCKVCGAHKDLRYGSCFKCAGRRKVGKVSRKKETHTEYSVLILDPNTDNAMKILKLLAESGWRVVCSYCEDRIILERRAG